MHECRVCGLMCDCDGEDTVVDPPDECLCAAKDIEEDLAEDADDDDLDFCGECGDTFRYDDVGGYNPPCACGFACRSCCNGRMPNCVKASEDDDEDDGDDFDPVDPDEPDPTMEGWEP